MSENTIVALLTTGGTVTVALIGGWFAYLTARLTRTSATPAATTDELKHQAADAGFTELQQQFINNLLAHIGEQNERIDRMEDANHHLEAQNAWLEEVVDILKLALREHNIPVPKLPPRPEPVNHST